MRYMNLNYMSLSRSRFPRTAGLLAGAVLMFGALPGAWAQSFPTTMTFTGTGTLSMAEAGYPGYTDVLSSISLTGSGLNVATAVDPSDPYYQYGADEHVTSSFASFNVSGNVTLSPTGNPSTGPISLTDVANPTFTLSTAFNDYHTTGVGVVFYPPDEGSDYTGNVANRTVPIFWTDYVTGSSVDSAVFPFFVTTRPDDLVLGTIDKSADSVTYHNSTFALATSENLNDPYIVYTRDITITSANLPPITPVPNRPG